MGQRLFALFACMSAIGTLALFRLPWWGILLCWLITLPALAYIAWSSRRKTYPPGHCQTCGYDMAGHEQTGRPMADCPECGHAYAPSHFHAPRTAGAFTVIELLVVVAIIGAVVGISFPYLSSMVRSTSEQMAANSVSNGVSAARAYSTRYKPFLNRDGKTGRTSEDTGDGYSGAVMIITPAREIRIAENDETALAPNGYRLELPASGSEPIRNGYKPIERLDDMRVPGAVAVLGIVRTGSTTFQLLPPPFAISFNRRGQMVVRNQQLHTATITQSSTRSDGRVYYDSDGDGVYNTSSTRASFGGTYSDYFRDTAEKIENASSPMDARRELPWEVIEPVIGVIIFDPKLVPQDVYCGTSGTPVAYNENQHDAYIIDTSNTNDKNILEWASEGGNGVVMFFNRFTGADTAR